MSRLEIIHLRSSGEPLESLCPRISESIRSAGPSTDDVTIYRRDELETDVAIHIRHLETQPRQGPSTLGLCLASALKAFGMVEHTLWEEL